MLLFPRALSTMAVLGMRHYYAGLGGLTRYYVEAKGYAGS